MSICIIIYPFRIFSLLSHIPFMKPLISFLNILFNLFQPLLIAIVFLGIVLIGYSLSIFVLLDDLSIKYSSILDALVYSIQLLSLNAQIPILEIYPKNYSLLFNIRLVIFSVLSYSVLLIFILLITTLIVLFKFSLIKEIKYNNTFSDIDEAFLSVELAISKIYEKINENKIMKTYKQINRITPQVLWLNTIKNTNSYYFYSKIASKFFHKSNLNVLHFENTKQIIAYLKYIFVIKPHFQFKYSEKRFIIIIHLDKVTNNVDLFDDLINYINYSKSKINIVFYLENYKISNFEKLNLLNACSTEISFCSNEGEIDNKIMSFHDLSEKFNEISEDEVSDEWSDEKIFGKKEKKSGLFINYMKKRSTKEISRKSLVQISDKIENDKKSAHSSESDIPDPPKRASYKKFTYQKSIFFNLDKRNSKVKDDDDEKNTLITNTSDSDDTESDFSNAWGLQSMKSLKSAKSKLNRLNNMKK